MVIVRPPGIAATALGCVNPFGVLTAAAGYCVPPAPVSRATRV
jgi:hypothetical protein